MLEARWNQTHLDLLNISLVRESDVHCLWLTLEKGSTQKAAFSYFYSLLKGQQDSIEKINVWVSTSKQEQKYTLKTPTWEWFGYVWFCIWRPGARFIKDKTLSLWLTLFHWKAQLNVTVGRAWLISAQVSGFEPDQVFVFVPS
jgi:hypothetical protein